MESKDELALEIRETLTKALRLSARYLQRFGSIHGLKLEADINTQEGIVKIFTQSGSDMPYVLEAEEAVKRGPGRPRKQEGTE